MSENKSQDLGWQDPNSELPENKEQVFVLIPAIYQDGKWVIVMDVYSWIRDPRVVPCDCYDNGRCNGTKERKTCKCGGQVAVCDFYPEKAHFVL